MRVSYLVEDKTDPVGDLPVPDPLTMKLLDPDPAKSDPNMVLTLDGNSEHVAQV